MRFFKSKIFKVLLCIILLAFMVSAIVYFIDFVVSKNEKEEPSFFDKMNGENVLLMPSGVAFERPKYDYSDETERVFRINSDMNFECIERDKKTKNKKTVSCGILEKVDITEHKGFLKLYEKPENVSVEFSNKEFLKNNKNAWFVSIYVQSEISTAGYAKKYIIFEQSDGSLYIGVAASVSDGWERPVYCYVLFETEIVGEDEIIKDEIISQNNVMRVETDYAFDFDSDGIKEELVIFWGGYDANNGSSTLVLAIFGKGFGALKNENNYKTRYYDDWIYDESYFLEENGELYYCYEYPAGVTKNKISLDKENNKVVIENHEECLNFREEETDIGTTAAPMSVSS